MPGPLATGTVAQAHVSGGAAGNGAVYTAPNAAGASAIRTTRPGALVYVETFRAYFTLKQGAEAPDGVTILAADDPAYRWYRVPPAHRSWLLQAAWEIDGAAGDDENTGAPGDPIRTHAELARRWGPWPLLPQPTTVSIVGDLAATDPVNVQILQGSLSSLTYQGTATLVRAGAITAVTARNRATNQNWLVTDGAVVWTPGERLRLTSGPSAGAVAWVLEDLGGGQCRTTEWILVDLPNGILSYAAPAVGNTYAVEALPLVTLGTLESRGYLDDVLSGAPILIWNDLHARENIFATSAIRSSATVYLQRSRFDAFVSLQDGSQVLTPPVVANCYFSEGAYLSPGAAAGFYAGAVRGALCGLSMLGASWAQVDFDAVIDGKGCLVGAGASLEVGAACFRGGAVDPFNPSASALYVAAGGTVAQNLTASAVTAIWGAGSPGFGLDVEGDGAAQYRSLASVPTVTGTSGDFQIARTSAGVPQNPATGAYAGAPVAFTWPNLAAAFPGGFGGAACHLTRGGRVSNRQ